MFSGSQATVGKECTASLLHSRECSLTTICTSVKEHRGILLWLNRPIAPDGGRADIILDEVIPLCASGAQDRLNFWTFYSFQAALSRSCV